MKACLQGLKKYKPENREGYIMMNANESNESFKYEFSANLNRYPENNSQALRKRIGEYNAIDPKNVIVGNGSSEMIDLLMKAYINPNDYVLSFDPTFVMYEKYTQIYGGNYKAVPTVNGVMDIDLMIDIAKEVMPKIIFICNPNNPTGSVISKMAIEKLLRVTQAYVVVDEAYGEYADVSMINRLSNYDNLIILKTFSKAYAMAALRLGYLIGRERVIDTLDMVRPPYNLNISSQAAGLVALDQSRLMREAVRTTIIRRDYMYSALLSLGYQVLKSYANYLFVKTDLPIDRICKEAGILIRGFNNGTFRITISSEEDNESLLRVLASIEVRYEKIV